MDTQNRNDANLNRRWFFKTTGAGLAAAGMALGDQANPAARALTEKEKLDRIASNTWPIRDIFKTGSTRTNPQTDALKKKYGEITMLDFPDFTKSTFPGVYHMDLFSGLFGDVTDPSMFTVPAGRGGNAAPAATPPARIGLTPRHTQPERRAVAARIAITYVR